MDQDYMTMRVWKRTHKKLRIIAAHQEEKIVETLERLADEELRRIGVSLEDSKGDKPEQD
jgi:hypothetical protein